MSFLYHLLIAIGIFGVGTWASTQVTGLPIESHVFFLFGAVGSQAWLAVAAIYLRSKRLANFDMIVASELIIALGILALICGIIIAVIFTSQSVDISRGLSFETLRPILTPFAEGLFAAGFAPVLATFLRQIEVLKYGAEQDDAAGGDKIGIELEGLRKQVDLVTQSLKELAEASEGSRIKFENSAASLDSAAANHLDSAKKTQQALKNLGKVVDTASSGLGTSFGEIDSHLESNRKQLAASTGQMDELTEATRRFKDASEEGAKLVEGLRAVVESVERFIHPDKAPR